MCRKHDTAHRDKHNTMALSINNITYQCNLIAQWQPNILSVNVFNKHASFFHFLLLFLHMPNVTTIESGVENCKKRQLETTKVAHPASPCRMTTVWNLKFRWLKWSHFVILVNFPVKFWKIHTRKITWNKDNRKLFKLFSLGFTWNSQKKYYTRKFIDNHIGSNSNYIYIS